MDRETMEGICAELEDEVRQRFPAGLVRGVSVLQYGDDPVIEPGELLVRVFLEAEGDPEDYDRLLDAFMYDSKAALAEFRRFIALPTWQLGSAGSPDGRPASWRPGGCTSTFGPQPGRRSIRTTPPPAAWTGPGPGPGRRVRRRLVIGQACRKLGSTRR